jgi:hypothetical protein
MQALGAAWGGLLDQLVDPQPAPVARSDLGIWKMVKAAVLGRGIDESGVLE